ncbi:MAG: class I SAM-dependent methyltransferase [Candidatus Acidiferrales bacterium]
MAVVTDAPGMNHRNPLIHEPTDERMVPESADLFTFWEHVYRYAFASRFVREKRVLDIACGEGYGAAALQKAGAGHVIGVDISEAVCLHAREKYGIDARTGDAERIPLDEGSVDVVVSFETIEHVPNPGRFLDECVRVLAPGGKLIISTPNKDIYGRAVQNPYHCSEMTGEEFRSALRSRFRDCRCYTQRPTAGAWWSARSLVGENSPWKRVRGFSRLRRAVQSVFVPEAIKPPTREQRESVSDIILDVGKNPRHLLNPYLLRPQREGDREKPTYLIAIAIRRNESNDDASKQCA